jgi:hypothetical protein
VDYQYDVFVSYTRRAGAGRWVKDNFYPALREALDNEMAREPVFYVDWEHETGVSWPQYIEHALMHSRLMVAVLSPPYFRSNWCAAEWESMCARNRLLGFGSPDSPRHLIHGVRYADGEHFPDEAANLQMRDFSEWTVPIPYDAYTRTPDYPHFYAEVRKLARDIAARVDHVPPWDADWPRLRPTAPARPVGPLPRL